MSDPLSILREFALYWVNGLLVLVWTATDRVALLVTFAVHAALVRTNAPAPRLQPWLLGMGVLSALAAGIAAPPVPVLMAAMSLCGALAVKLDRFNPDALRWRVAGGLALYALASLGYLAYTQYLSLVDAELWARRIGGQAEAGDILAQGRSFLDTLATWGLWLILPIGYMSLLAQGLLVHPPMGSPVETVDAIRTRNRE